MLQLRAALQELYDQCPLPLTKAELEEVMVHCRAQCHRQKPFAKWGPLEFASWLYRPHARRGADDRRSGADPRDVPGARDALVVSAAEREAPVTFMDLVLAFSQAWCWGWSCPGCTIGESSSGCTMPGSAPAGCCGGNDRDDSPLVDEGIGHVARRAQSLRARPVLRQLAHLGAARPVAGDVCPRRGHGSLRLWRVGDPRYGGLTLVQVQEVSHEPT